MRTTPTASSVTPAPNASLALPEHHPPSVGRPQWYGVKLGKEDRSWLSQTGDVFVYGGNTFPTSFRKLGDALDHAREMSEGELGAVLVMHTKHVGEGSGAHHARNRYFLTRSYNAEPKDGGLYVGQSHFDGSERFSDLDRDVRAVVDGEFTVVRDHS